MAVPPSRTTGLAYGWRQVGGLPRAGASLEVAALAWAVAFTFTLICPLGKQVPRRHSAGTHWRLRDLRLTNLGNQAERKVQVLLVTEDRVEEPGHESSFSFTGISQQAPKAALSPRPGRRSRQVAGQPESRASQDGALPATAWGASAV